MLHCIADRWESSTPRLLVVLAGAVTPPFSGEIVVTTFSSFPGGRTWGGSLSPFPDLRISINFSKARRPIPPVAYLGVHRLVMNDGDELQLLDHLMSMGRYNDLLIYAPAQLGRQHHAKSPHGIHELIFLEVEPKEHRRSGIRAVPAY